MVAISIATCVEIATCMYLLLFTNAAVIAFGVYSNIVQFLYYTELLACMLYTAYSYSVFCVCCSTCMQLPTLEAIVAPTINHDIF